MKKVERIPDENDLDRYDWSTAARGKHAEQAAARRRSYGSWIRDWHAGFRIPPR